MTYQIDSAVENVEDRVRAFFFLKWKKKHEKKKIMKNFEIVNDHL